MAGESISIPILTPGADAAARNIKQVGNASAETAAKLDVAAASLEAFNLAALKSAKADQTLVASKKASAKADQLWADSINVLTGKQTKFTKLLADQGRALDDTAKKAANAAGKSGLGALIGGGGPQGGGLGALIAAGVVLSPVIATVGTGLAGFGAAAYGVAKPIENAAQKTGGLAANLSKLNPEQQKVARGILSLGQDFAAFQRQMQPEVFGVFNQGLSVARTLLHGIEPVAAATGKALGSALGQIGAEFQSGEWQQFFGFMARTAGPDIQLLTRNFVGLLQVLPPLLENLQPVATTLLKDTSGLLNLVSAIEKGSEAEHKFTQEAQNNTGWLGKLAHAAGQAFTELVPGGVGIKHVADELGKLGSNSSTAGKGLHDTGAAAGKSATPVWNLNTAIGALNASMTTLVGNLLSLQGGNLAWQQAMQAAQSQLRSNSAGLEGNSKNAIANRQAVLGTTQAAIDFAQKQLTLGKDISGASNTVQAQIRWLQGLHDKSKFVQDEIKALRLEEQRLQAQRMNQLITVHGKGTWSVVGTGPFAGKPTSFGARGMRVPGTGSGDTVPAMLTPGEAVVPKHLVPAVAPFLKANQVPGFASGGIVPSYSGDVGGLKPWLTGNDQATVRLIDQAVVKATLAGIKSATAAARSFANRQFPGGGGGGSGEAIARAMFPWPASMWPAFNYVEMREAGYNLHARNPSSGAYGVAQFINGPSEYYQYGGNPNTFQGQFTGMFNYIRQRYGNPVNAANHERAFNWYGNGLKDGIFTRPTLIGVGDRPERVNIAPLVQPSRSGGQQTIVFEIAPGGEGALTSALMQVLRKQIRVRGGGDVQLALGRL